jgi:hypothetical protein
MGVVTGQPADPVGTGNSPYGPLIQIAATPRPYVLPRGNFMVICGANDSLWIVTPNYTYPLNQPGASVAFVISDGTHVQIQGTGPSSTLIPCYGA